MVGSVIPDPIELAAKMIDSRSPWQCLNGFQCHSFGQFHGCLFAAFIRPAVPDESMMTVEAIRTEDWESNNRLLGGQGPELEGNDRKPKEKKDPVFCLHWR